MSRTQILRTPFALLACFALLFSAIGCSGDSLTGPSEGSNLAATEFQLNDISTPEGELNTSYDPCVAVMFISAAQGGMISNGRVTLEFPPGALENDTNISMRMVAKSYLQVEFAPHGIVFNKPVLMRLNLVGTVAEDQAKFTTIKWWNPATSAWEKIVNLAPENSNESKALLEHFSRYGGING